MILAGPIVAVPVGLWLSRRAGPGVLTGVLAAAAFFVEPPMSAAFVLPYVIWTGWLALRAVPRLTRRWWEREALVDLGEIYLLVGALWLLGSRTGEEILGFDRTITALTAAHFHFAGFAAATVAGVTSRMRPIPAWAAICVGLGPALVGLGFVISPHVEVVSAVALALGMLGLAWGMARAWWPLGLPGFVLVGTMALAVVYAGQQFTGLYLLTIPTMAQLHGMGNVLGFALPALILLALRRPEPPALIRLGAPPPFGPEEPGPKGLYERPEDLGLADLPAPIAAYFCDSEAAALEATPTWLWPALGRLAARIGHALGNFALPTERTLLKHEVRRVAPGWVRSRRTHPDGRPMLVLNYVLDRGRMRAIGQVAPGLSLDFFFRSSWDGERLEVFSEYTHLRVGRWLIRLPLAEVLDGRLEDDLFLAEQRIVLAGVELLLLSYRIGPASRLR